ncbi:MAG: HAMP domain-containing histidine kinase [Actinomycetota bacterium]|nr:MAG: HAMP domain-containing histidine kinase [Actinomycetota bacterium]
MAVVAAVAVVVAGLVSIPLVRNAAVAQARSTLGDLADLVAATLDGPRPPDTLDPRLRQLLAAQSVSEAYVVGPGLGRPEVVSPLVAAQLAAGLDVSTTAATDQGEVFLEGRPLGAGLSVVLVQPASIASQPADDAVRRLAVALVIGLAIAVVIGVLAARRLTRPLRSAADAANRMSAGERDVQLVPEGPAEVAEIAESLNRLSAALAASEGRQREFLLSVSHELRTPLTAVRGYAEALSDGVVAPDDVTRTGATMRAEAERLDRLVADLLDLARLGAADFRVDPVELDLASFGADAAEVWRVRCARAGITWHAELPAPVLVRTDPVRLRQIVDNLAENALRVTPAGRPVVLALRPDGDGWFVVEVRDGGPGLTADDLAVAFEPAALYARYRGVRTVGSGVGLALVGSLAQRLGGHAVAGVAPEGGARFTVRLPGGQGGGPLPGGYPRSDR